MLFLVRLTYKHIIACDIPTEYEVVVVTGNVKGAGTDSNISMTLFGKTGQTPKLSLKSISRNTFERSQSDIFVLKTVCCGPLTKIRCVATYI